MKYTQEDMIEQKRFELIMGVTLAVLWVFLIISWYSTKDFIYHPFDTNWFILGFLLTYFVVALLCYFRNRIKESLKIQRENEEYYNKMQSGNEKKVPKISTPSYRIKP